MSEARPYRISKWEVWKAYEKVKANKGAAGVDEQSIQGFERKLKDNLYKIWNRMSSGSYFPPPVRSVKIDKDGGGKRKLGIPTVSDRIAQMVVKSRLEPVVDPLFVPDSYGYRPGKSAHEAVGQARQRCWNYDWVVDLDIRGFFDNIDHELMNRAVRKHAKETWMVLYIERWLTAPMQEEDGQRVPRAKGTPQGGVVSPLLANLFLHYAFDLWMQRNYPQLRFERYADDVIVHCRTEKQAQEVRATIARRMQECRLELHPEKTKMSIARMMIEGNGMLMRSLIFWAIRFVPEARRVGRESTSSTSVRPFPRKPARPYGARFATGSCTCAATHRLRIFPVCLTRSSGVGFNSTGGFTARGYIPSGGTSTACSPDGRRGNTRSCGTVSAEPSSGCCVLLNALHSSLLTGSWVRGVALQWEPYELRGSCTVLRERGGATPPRHSPRH